MGLWSIVLGYVIPHSFGVMHGCNTETVEFYMQSVHLSIPRFFGSLSILCFSIKWCVFVHVYTQEPTVGDGFTRSSSYGSRRNAHESFHDRFVHWADLTSRSVISTWQLRSNLSPSLYRHHRLLASIDRTRRLITPLNDIAAHEEGSMYHIAHSRSHLSF